MPKTLFERMTAAQLTPKARSDFAPCPVCHQYSHSLSDGQVVDALMHFQSMFSHRGDGIPTQYSFDEKTRDAAQVMMAMIEGLTEALQAIEDGDGDAQEIARETLERLGIATLGEGR